MSRRAAASRSLHRTGRRLVTIPASLVLGLATLGVAHEPAAAVPAPPPTPNDAQIEARKAAAVAKAGEVAVLTNRLAELDTQRLASQAEAELTRELANKT